MGQVANQVQHEFWRPPMPEAVVSDAAASQQFIEACRRCGTEFIVSSRFCHACGASRPELNAGSRVMDLPGLAELSVLGERFGLSTASLIAFLLGIVCVIVTLSIGVIFSEKTPLDWQAIQVWRIQWLLGAIAAFVAGSLLKKSS